MFIGDYHTHTRFSDGKGTVWENALAAKARSLREIAVTDHGFRIPTMSFQKFLKAKALCREAEEQTGIRVFAGVEANIISDEGDLDLSEEQIGEVEYLIAGFHKFAIPKNLRSFLDSYAVTYFNGAIKTSRTAVERNTRAVIRAIEKYPLKALAHVNHSLKVDVYAVAKACREKGVLVELNAKHLNDLEGEWAALIESGADFVLNSDAHTPSAVGAMDSALQTVLAAGIPADKIKNYIGE